MSDYPVIADNKPKKVSLNKDQEYYFCVCGRSENQPFCDGSHKGTSGLNPRRSKLKRAKMLFYVHVNTARTHLFVMVLTRSFQPKWLAKKVRV